MTSPETESAVLWNPLAATLWRPPRNSDESRLVYCRNQQFYGPMFLVHASSMPQHDIGRSIDITTVKEPQARARQVETELHSEQQAGSGGFPWSFWWLSGVEAHDSCGVLQR